MAEVNTEFFDELVGAVVGTIQHIIAHTRYIYSNLAPGNAQKNFEKSATFTYTKLVEEIEKMNSPIIKFHIFEEDYKGLKTIPTIKKYVCDHIFDIFFYQKATITLEEAYDAEIEKLLQFLNFLEKLLDVVDKAGIQVRDHTIKR